MYLQVNCYLLAATYKSIACLMLILTVSNGIFGVKINVINKVITPSNGYTYGLLLLIYFLPLALSIFFAIRYFVGAFVDATVKHK